MPNDNEKKKIIEEINTTGFPLELRITKFLNDNEYHVANNLFYVDQDENKGREIDMRALGNFAFKKDEKEYFVRHCLLVECKRSADKPWVIFTSSQTIYDQTLFKLHCKGVKDQIRWFDTGIPQQLQEHHPFMNYSRRGRSFFEPFKGSNPVGFSIYKSLITSVKAAIAMRDNEFGVMEGSACIYYPIVIFDGKLYEAYLDDRSEIYAEEVESVLVSFYYESVKYRDERFMIPVLTEKALPDFISSLSSVLQLLGKKFRNNINWYK